MLLGTTVPNDAASPARAGAAGVAVGAR